MLTYQIKDNLIFKLHPITQISFIIIVFVLSLIFTNPLYLLGLLIPVGAVISAADTLDEWKGYLKITILMIAVIVLVNTLFAGTGSTIIYRSPSIPLLGSIVITLEAIVFSLGMSIRLLVIISIFCLYTYVVNPDKSLKLLSRLGGRSILAITLSVRLFPLMIQDFKRISEVQRCRGVRLETGSWWDRARNFIPIISIMLLSSMERSMQLAESMYARGYGSGSRSYYNNELWRPRDYLILSLTAIALTAGIWSAVTGWSSFSYYPKLEKIDASGLIGAAIIILTLLFPAILNWGWKKWPTLKSRI